LELLNRQILRTILQGQFQWTRTSQSLHSAPSQYQRLMELTVKGLHNIIVYIDDLLVHNSDHAQHRLSLQTLFNRLPAANLKLNIEKCEFGSENVTYLGFRLTPQGIFPGTDKLAAVKNATPPTNVHQVRQFLGLANFFRTHIRNFSLMSSPLNLLTRKDTVWRGGILPPAALRHSTNSVVLSALNLLLIILAKTDLMLSSSTPPPATTRTRAASAVSCVKPMTTVNFTSLLMPADLYLNMKKIILHFFYNSQLVLGVSNISVFI
jgi:hypothetical protein